MTTTITLEPGEDLKSVLQEFVDSAQPPEGVAYLLNRVDDGFYVPVACSKPDVLKGVPYYLRFSKLPPHKVDGVCYPIDDGSVKAWLESGRIESIVFAADSRKVYQQFTHLADKRGSLVLVRSAPADRPIPQPVPTLSDETKRLCKPLLSWVFSRWASTSYDRRLDAIRLNQGPVELETVVRHLMQILDDRDPFPPYWEFSYFSLRVVSGVAKLDAQCCTNALGLARWSQKELASLKPWIQKMASVKVPAWEDIQEVAKHNEDYKKVIEQSDATAKVFIERLKDWIVPVCNFEEWRFYARHNKGKECEHGYPHLPHPSSARTPRSAVATILKHSEHDCATREAAKTGDFLVTLWALKVDKQQNVLEAIPIGGRVAENFAYVIKESQVHDVLPEGKSASKGEKVRLDIRYAPIPGHDATKTTNEFERLSKRALNILESVDPKANLKNILSDIFRRHSDWNEFFERPDSGRYHHPCDWMANENSDFDALIPEVQKVLESLAPILRISESEIAALNNVAPSTKKRWCINVAKALNHGRVSPELLLLVAEKGIINWPSAYEIIGDHERSGSTPETALIVATEILYGMSLLTRTRTDSKTDAFNLVEFSKRDSVLLNHNGDPKPVLFMRFESPFQKDDIALSIGAVFHASESLEELKGKCRLLDKHSFGFSAGFTNRDSMVEDQVVLKKMFTLLFEFRMQWIEGKLSKEGENPK